MSHRQRTHSPALFFLPMLLLAALLSAVPNPAFSQGLTVLSDVHLEAGRGIRIGSTNTNTAPGEVRYAPPSASNTTAGLEIYDGTNWVLAAGSGSGSGTGFPLTNDTEIGRFALTNAALLSADTGQFGNLIVQTNASIANSLTVSNDLRVDGTSDFNGNADFEDDVTIHGDLDVIGTTYQTTIVNLQTNVYIGTTTNYVATTVYSTNAVYTYTYLVTNITNNVTVDTYVNVNGTWDATNANWVALPGLYLDGPETNTSATATGPWDFSGAVVTGISIPDAYTNLFTGSGTTGAVSSADSDTNKFLRGDGTWAEVVTEASAGVTNPLFIGSMTNDGVVYLGVDTNSVYVKVSGGDLVAGNISATTQQVTGLNKDASSWTNFPNFQPYDYEGTTSATNITLSFTNGGFQSLTLTGDNVTNLTIELPPNTNIVWRSTVDIDWSGSGTFSGVDTNNVTVLYDAPTVSSGTTAVITFEYTPKGGRRWR